MVRTWSIIFGIGLGILWIVGLSSPMAAGWLTWLDGVAAVLAFIMAGTTVPTTAQGTRMGGPIGLAIGLFALWIIGMATDGAPWQNWWTFAFACAFLVLGIAATRVRVAPTGEVVDRSRDQFRRSA